jgi:cobalt-zinc-cadmium efflux system protein
MGLGVAMLVVEVAAGFLANSLVLLSDAAHVSTDVAALALAYFAIRMGARPATAAKSYGYRRAEIVAAFLNALLLWALSAWFLYEAWSRLQAPPSVNGGIVAIVGAVGLGVNVLMAVLLHGGQEHSVNVRGAYLHVLSDALGSVAAIVAGLGVYFYGARWLDPAATLVVSMLILVWTWRLTKDSLHVLLEGTPHSISAEAVRATIAGVPGVVAVHDLHVWSITTGVDNLSAHVVVEDARDGPAVVRRIRDQLRQDHRLQHVTIEVEADDSECVGCN